MARTFGKTRDCAGCRYWSEMIAQSVDELGLQAMCLGGDEAPKRGKYTYRHQTCTGWKSGHHGAVDAPPNYGEAVRAAYEAEESA